VAHGLRYGQLRPFPPRLELCVCDQGFGDFQVQGIQPRRGDGNDTLLFDTAGFDISPSSLTAAGGVYARSDYTTYTRGGITHILAGSSSDVDLILAADLDGDLPDHSGAGGIHYAKPDIVVSGYDLFADQN